MKPHQPDPIRITKQAPLEQPHFEDVNDAVRVSDNDRIQRATMAIAGLWEQAGTTSLQMARAALAAADVQPPAEERAEVRTEWGCLYPGAAEPATSSEATVRRWVSYSQNSDPRAPLAGGVLVRRTHTIGPWVPADAPTPVAPPAPPSNTEGVGVGASTDDAAEQAGYAAVWARLRDGHNLRDWAAVPMAYIDRVMLNGWMWRNVTAAMRAALATERRPDRCPECRCDPVLCETDTSGEHCAGQSCPTCLHGCPRWRRGTCPPCDRGAERQVQELRDSALRDLIELLDGLVPDLAHLPPISVEGIRERVEHARQWLPRPPAPRPEDQALMARMNADAQPDAQVRLRTGPHPDDPPPAA
jgi:hypothetical protein